eukprot:CAMPEP_0180007788 /NCGR_PEP_ID=MMETSP0984-20121128/14123_1 /TAXON_ID=483367 /ORGANISM="non described non described, Strain CCMP 2436" /LENGTH=56 /DNA_ID=CAMNT_0021929005 /DNA_START=733 /DNA_END=901 /DNA_ORIENTATION=+
MPSLNFTAPRPAAFNADIHAAASHPPSSSSSSPRHRARSSAVVLAFLADVLKPAAL